MRFKFKYTYPVGTPKAGTTEVFEYDEDDINCCVSLMPMEDPVTTGCGHSFDKQYLHNWLLTPNIDGWGVHHPPHHNCPKCRKLISPPNGLVINELPDANNNFVEGSHLKANGNWGDYSADAKNPVTHNPILKAAIAAFKNKNNGYEEIVEAARPRVANTPLIITNRERQRQAREAAEAEEAADRPADLIRAAFQRRQTMALDEQYWTLGFNFPPVSVPPTIQARIQPAPPPPPPPILPGFQTTMAGAGAAPPAPPVVSAEQALIAELISRRTGNGRRR